MLVFLTLLLLVLMRVLVLTAGSLDRSLMDQESLRPAPSPSLGPQALVERARVRGMGSPGRAARGLAHAMRAFVP